VGDILLSINNEAVEKQPGYLDAMKNYLRLFLIECARQALEDQGQDAARISGPQASVERTRRYLDENWREEIDLNKLAERARMSKPHLCRIFRRYTGKTIIEYLHQRRIEQAMIMLDSTSEKVITIASEAGFGDLAHFNRIFRRITGKTPTSFRKRSEQQCGDMAAEAEADVSLSVTTKSDGAADR
jgi:AraC-like DNA-binding protein